MTQDDSPFGNEDDRDKAEASYDAMRIMAYLTSGIAIALWILYFLAGQ